MQPKISVIVPVYKVENYLTQCLDSIVNQTFKEIEIIVIDEGDHDRCREIIDYFESIDDRIVAIHEKQGGYGNSMNFGFSIARGEYIGIIESDDFIESDMFEKLYYQIKRFDADIVKSPYYQYYNVDNEDIVPIEKELIEQLPTEKDFTLMQYPILLSTHPSIWAGLYNAEWLKKTGIKFLEKGAYLDIKFRFETLLAARKICWVNKPFYHWRITNPTSTNASWNLRAALERWDYIHDYFSNKKEEWNSLATYMLPEENLNLFIRYNLLNCSKEQRIKIKRYLNLYPINTIKNNPYVDPYFKNNFLLGNTTKLFFSRIIRNFINNYRSTIYRHFSYKALIVIMVCAFAFNSFPDNGIFLFIKNIFPYFVLFSGAVFSLYWLSLGLLRARIILKRIIRFFK